MTGAPETPATGGESRRIDVAAGRFATTGFAASRLTTRDEHGERITEAYFVDLDRAIECGRAALYDPFHAARQFTVTDALGAILAAEEIGTDARGDLTVGDRVQYVERGLDRTVSFVGRLAGRTIAGGVGRFEIRVETMHVDGRRVSVEAPTAIYPAVNTPGDPGRATCLVKWGS